MTQRMTPLLRKTGESPSHPALPPSPPERPAFLSEADCRALLAQLARAAQGGGATTVNIHSSWTGHVRWARNQVSSLSDVRSDLVQVLRDVNGANAGTGGSVLINDLAEASLVAAVRRAERLAQLKLERPQSDLVSRFQPEAFERQLPNLFSNATYQLDEVRRATVAQQLAQAATVAGMLSAGYIEVSAHSMAQLDTYGRVWYYQYTQAQYSVTVRDPKGLGSGWAGMDHYDWTKLDAPALSQKALDKCLASRNPVRLEPGRYTTILEPQAVCDFVGPLVIQNAIDRQVAEIQENRSPFFKQREPANRATGMPQLDKSMLGDLVIDARLSISADPHDPELGFPPINLNPLEFVGDLPFLRGVYHPVTWIKDGVLVNLAYDRQYGASLLGQDTGLPNPGAFRMSVTGPTASVDEMIAGTARGLLVTRFGQVAPQAIDRRSQLYVGTTRDGLWLIEHGKISKPVHNLVFDESILFALNNVEQIGVPQRVFHPPVAMLFPQMPKPVIVPALKIKDFSFTALDDAV